MHSAPDSSSPYGQSPSQPGGPPPGPQRFVAPPRLAPPSEATSPRQWPEASASPPWPRQWPEASASPPSPEAPVVPPGAAGPGPTHPTWHAPYGQHPYPVPPPEVHAWVDYHGAADAVVGSMWRPAAESGPPARLVAWGQRNAGPVGRLRRGTVLVGALAAGLLATAAAMMLL